MLIDTSEMLSMETILKTYANDVETIKLAKTASTYLYSHIWCDKIEKQWFVANWENLLAIFFFKITTNTKDVNEYVWLVVGDLPSICIDVESAANEQEVVKAYVGIMEDWIKCVHNKGNIKKCYPINVPPTKGYADMLKVRMSLIKEHILEETVSE